MTPITTRKRHTVSEKLAILDACKGCPASVAAAQYGVCRATIALWRANEQLLREQHPSCRRVVRTSNTDMKSTHSKRTNTVNTHCDLDNGSTPDASPTPQQTDTQPPLLVGYVGQRHTVADIAVRSIFPQLPIRSFETVGFPHSIDAMDALKQHKLEYCVVSKAWLLSCDSSVTLSEFSKRNLQIVAELVTSPEICISALNCTDLRNCDSVMTDVAVLQSYEPMILKLETEHNMSIVRQLNWDSAAACFTIRKEKVHGIAVLATKAAALDAGLAILDTECSGDRKQRHLVLGRKHCTPLPIANAGVQPSATIAIQALNKTTVFIKMENRRGWLSSIVQAFPDADADIVDIQSRILPTTNTHDNHQILVTFVVSKHQPSSTSRVLERLVGIALSACVLGTHATISITSE